MVYRIKDFSYTDRLKYLKLPSLKARRLRGDLIQTWQLKAKIWLSCKPTPQIPILKSVVFAHSQREASKQTTFNFSQS